MNSIRNYVQLIGRIGQNPEVKSFDGGNKLAKFSLATNESYVDKDGKKVENTQWHNITAWGGVATIAEKYVTKGREVAIQGKLLQRSYEDKNGVTHYVTEIVAKEIQLFANPKS